MFIQNFPRAFLVSLTLGIGVSACTTSPTGRSQFIVVSDAQMSAMGVQAYSELKKNEIISGDIRKTEYVRCVANQIINQLPGNYARQNWEINLFQDPSPNAFALPGGKIGVNTGIFKAATNQHQLATVLAHEIGHVIAQHGAERVSTSMATDIGLQVVEIAAGASGQPLGQGAVAALGMGAQYGVLMPFGRTQESEADRIGLDLMARAGFNPQEAVGLWQNMAKLGGTNPPEFLSTHPSGASRITDLNANMRNAQAVAQAANRMGKNPQCQP